MEPARPGKGRFLRVLLTGVSADDLAGLPSRPHSVTSAGQGRLLLIFETNAGSINGLLASLLQSLPPRAEVLETGFVETCDLGEHIFSVSHRLSIRLLASDNESDSYGDDDAVAIRSTLSFGSGFHPTTRMCLKMLDKFFQMNPSPARVLDVGTGSGILALAAARLGAEKVAALDISFPACLEARRNVLANRAERVVTVFRGSLDSVRSRFDLVTANLAVGPLTRLAPQLGSVTWPGGLLIVSGFFPVQRSAILDALGSGVVLNTMADGEWLAMLWQRNA